MISKELVSKIKEFQWINEYRLFHDEYLGNHYEILLMPRQWSFEVIEAKLPGSVWNKGKNPYFCQDSENYYGRKKYAENVTGAYYANRLAAAEYLGRIRRQASVLVFRESRKEYFAPCGVGILREVSRSAMQKRHESFATLKEAINAMQARLHLPVSNFSSRSRLLSEVKQQRTLIDF